MKLSSKFPCPSRCNRDARIKFHPWAQAESAIGLHVLFIGEGRRNLSCYLTCIGSDEPGFHDAEKPGHLPSTDSHEPVDRARLLEAVALHSEVQVSVMLNWVTVRVEQGRIPIAQGLMAFCAVEG